MPNPDLSQLFDKRLLFVTGKGGVGKSVVSAAAAVWSARQGQRTLWVEMTEAPRGGYFFPDYTPRYEPVRISDNLCGMNLRFQPAIEEYLEIVFRVPLVSRSIARNSLFRVFTTALPGLDALVTTGKIWYEAERTYRGKPYWDKIVVDAPATGHGLALLRFPHAALDIISSGPVADRARDIDRMLGDRANTALIAVTLLEELPVDEVLELVSSIDQDTGYDVSGIVMNGLFPEVGEPDPKRFQAWLAGKSDPAITTALGKAESGYREHLNWLQNWRRDQTSHIERIEQSGIDAYLAPWLPSFSESELLESFVDQIEVHADVD